MRCGAARTCSEEDDFLERFHELMLLETRGFPAGHPFHNVHAMPRGGAAADLSARLIRLHRRSWPARSARLLPSRIISPTSTRSRRCGSIATISGPRRAWREPYAILGTHVVCADTDAEAEHLRQTVDLNFVRRAKGEYLPLASPEDAAAYDYSPADRARIAQNRTGCRSARRRP